MNGRIPENLSTIRPRRGDSGYLLVAVDEGTEISRGDSQAAPGGLTAVASRRFRIEGHGDTVRKYADKEMTLKMILAFLTTPFRKNISEDDSQSLSDIRKTYLDEVLEVRKSLSDLYKSGALNIHAAAGHKK